jgi:hypothetical protein
MDRSATDRSALALIAVASLAACAPRLESRAPSAPFAADDVCARAPSFAAESSFFERAEIEEANAVDLKGHGDLWVSCSSNGTLFTAFGDGFGFAERTGPRPDIGVATLRGLPWEPSAVQGSNVVTDRAKAQKVFRVWTKGPYYQKPTGILCRRGTLFLAVQDLNAPTYDDAPAATIAESNDGGATWVEDFAAPMFARGVFTTIMFLDAGPDNRDAPGGYAYAYGLDFNFRGSGKVASPQALYLARIDPTKSPRDLRAWEFFAGDASAPAWSHDLRERQPVLVDCTRRHPREGSRGEAVLGQGGVVYDAPLARYLYTSWSEYTFEFYEAPSPWGPWRRFLTKDFGMPPWTETHHGGYGTSAPSLYISGDGKTLWVQSNTWASGVDHNNLAFRRLTLVPRAP